jgi:hypothetical protein
LVNMATRESWDSIKTFGARVLRLGRRSPA